MFVNSYDSSHVPSSGIFGSSKEINEIIIPPVDTSELKNNILKRLNSAEPKPVDISPILKSFKEIKGKDVIYRQKVIAQNATSIAITLDKLNLSKNAQLYLYNPEGTVITGPITAKENIGLDKKNKQWSSNSFKGNSIIIELKIPQEEVDQNALHVFKIRYGLPKTLNENLSDSALIGTFNSSSSCNRNLVCPEGNNWQIERNAVCLIQSPTRGASGALIKNTCNTLIPYILTAWHVTNGDNPNNFTFLFGWLSSTCTPNTNTSQSILFNGATLRATYEPTDFSLIQLNQVPSTNLNLSFLGWDRSSNIPASTTGIHHPQGDQMKISFDTRPPTIGNVRTNSNTAWRTLWTLGTIEPGSSGSPLFNQNRLVVGQLFSGTQPTQPPCNQQTGGNNYGRFDLSWTGGGTNATRLSNWLDPNNSGAITTNTTNIANLTNVSPALTISGSDFCTSTTYTVNAPAGTTVVCSATSGIVNINSATGYATKVSDGSALITATVTFCGGATATVSKRVSVGIPNNYYIQRMSMASTNRLDIYPSFSGYQLSVTSWNVYVDGSFSTSGSGYPPSVISVYASSGSHSITLTVYNSCGSYSTSSSYSGYSHYAITPNPANGNVTITDKAANSKSALTGGKVTITVFDNTNRPLKQFSFSPGNHYNFSVVGLTPGIYTVQIKQNGSVSSLKLIKQ